MLKRGILKPILPEITADRLDRLRDLLATEREAAVSPDPLRRLAALLPEDSATSDDVAVRLRFSNNARKRLACAAEPELGSSPRALAYRLGNTCAVDRLLLAGRAREAAEIAEWKAPRLPIGGGTLIARGLSAGPIVARTLRQIERRWVDSGFPTGDELERIVQEELDSAAQEE